MLPLSTRDTLMQRPMSDLQIIEELSTIVEIQSAIIRTQRLRLGELSAVIMEEEIAKADERVRCLLGDGETPRTFNCSDETHR